MPFYLLLKYAERMGYPDVEVVAGSAAFPADEPIPYVRLTVGARVFEIFDAYGLVTSQRPLHLIKVAGRDLETFLHPDITGI